MHARISSNWPGKSEDTYKFHITMRRPYIIITTIVLICCLHPAFAQHIDYTPDDSTEITDLMRKAHAHFQHKATDKGQIVLFFARHFIGRPYVAHTQEKNSIENIIVNTKELDCTTLVETVAALTKAYYKKGTFADFVSALESIRYRNGKVNGYASRLHYFSWWISDNEKRHNVIDLGKDGNYPYIAKQKIDVHFMSSNPLLYRQLADSPALVEEIKQYEDQQNGETVNYIPKNLLNLGQQQLGIKDGDIIALVTSKDGLDISHVGFAAWKGDKLHLLNASSLAHNVIEDSNTLFSYEAKRRSLLGIRVIRLR